MKILIVDDDRLNLIIAKDHIINTGIKCDILLCDKAEDVLGTLESSKVDIVLLDIVMPGMTGVQVIEKIRSVDEYKDIQVIMLTSLTDSENFKKCFDLGADDYILKPINFVEFNSRLKAAVKTRTNALMMREMFVMMKNQNHELKEVNQKLKDTQFHMVQKEKLASIGELAAGVAHEINNPIGYVGSNLETLGSFVSKIKVVINTYRKFINSLNPNSINIKELLNEINEIHEAEKKNKLDFVMGDIDSLIKDSIDGTERISKIVQSLRNFARTGLEDEINLYNLNNIIDEALLIVKNDAKYTIDIEMVKSEIPEVLCNKGQIGQLVLNLLVNSIQAIKSQDREDRGKISIRTYSDECFVCFEVEDDGAGIEKEVIKKIFDPFFTTKDVGKGTGLGLSISYDIITKKHNGELLVESNPGKGTVFTIKLPIKK